MSTYRQPKEKERGSRSETVGTSQGNDEGDREGEKMTRKRKEEENRIERGEGERKSE